MFVPAAVANSVPPVISVKLLVCVLATLSDISWHKQLLDMQDTCSYLTVPFVCARPTKQCKHGCSDHVTFYKETAGPESDEPCIKLNSA
jgi:hypothetical protein